MAKKEFKLRGKSLEDLQKMGLKEMASYLPAAARRKIKRGFKDREKKLLNDIKGGKKNPKTHCRDMIVLPEMVGNMILVHGGKNFQNVMIESDMIGHRLGEFVLTRNRVRHNAPGIGATKSSAALSVR